MLIWDFKVCKISQNSLRLRASTPVVGSSKRGFLGLWIKAQHKASFYFMPPERSFALRFLKGTRV